MVEELQTLQIAPVSPYPYLSIAIFVLLVIYGIVLLCKSKESQSRWLKVGILLPLIFFIFGIVIFGIAFLIAPIAIFYLFMAIPGGIPVSIISVVCSTISLFKSENKTLSILAIVYGIIYFLISLYVSYFLKLGSLM